MVFAVVPAHALEPKGVAATKHDSRNTLDGSGPQKDVGHLPHVHGWLQIHELSAHAINGTMKDYKFTALTDKAMGLGGCFGLGLLYWIRLWMWIWLLVMILGYHESFG